MMYGFLLAAGFIGITIIVLLRPDRFVDGVLLVLLGLIIGVGLLLEVRKSLSPG